MKYVYSYQPESCPFYEYMDGIEIRFPQNSDCNLYRMIDEFRKK